MTYRAVVKVQHTVSLMMLKPPIQLDIITVCPCRFIGFSHTSLYESWLKARVSHNGSASRHDRRNVPESRPSTLPVLPGDKVSTTLWSHKPTREKSVCFWTSSAWSLSPRLLLCQSDNSLTNPWSCRVFWCIQSIRRQWQMDLKDAQYFYTVYCIQIPSELSQWKISSERCTGSVFLQNQSPSWKRVELLSLPVWIASIWALLANLKISDCVTSMDLIGFVPKLNNIPQHGHFNWNSYYIYTTWCEVRPICPRKQIKRFHDINNYQQCMMLNFGESNVWIFSCNHTSRFLYQGNCSTDAESNDAANLPQENLPKPQNLSVRSTWEKIVQKEHLMLQFSQSSMMFKDFWREGPTTCVLQHISCTSNAGEACWTPDLQVAAQWQGSDGFFRNEWWNIRHHAVVGFFGCVFLAFSNIFELFEPTSCLSWTQVDRSHVNFGTSSDCTKTPSSRAFTSHASSCSHQSRNKTPMIKKKKQVNPYFPVPWQLICLFQDKYCMINRAYICKSLCKCVLGVPLTHEASSMPSCVADTSKFNAYKFAPPIHFNSCHHHHNHNQKHNQNQNSNQNRSHNHHLTCFK